MPRCMTHQALKHTGWNKRRRAPRAVCCLGRSHWGGRPPQQYHQQRTKAEENQGSDPKASMYVVWTWASPLVPQSTLVLEQRWFPSLCKRVFFRSSTEMHTQTVHQLTRSRAHKRCAAASLRVALNQTGPAAHCGDVWSRSPGHHPRIHPGPAKAARPQRSSNCGVLGSWGRHGLSKGGGRAGTPPHVHRIQMDWTNNVTAAATGRRGMRPLEQQVVLKHNTDCKGEAAAFKAGGRCSEGC